MLNKVDLKEMGVGGASTLIYSLCPSPPSTRLNTGASAPPHPANPSLSKVGAGGRAPSDARARAAAPGATPFPPAAGAPGPGKERAEGAVLAWRRVAAAVGGVGRRLRVALVRTWARSHAAPAAGLLSPAPCACRWCRLARGQEQEAAPGMGGRKWPPRPLLCIIVTQAISCLEV